MRTGTSAVDVRLMQALQNFIGWDGKTDCVAGPTPFWGSNGKHDASMHDARLSLWYGVHSVLCVSPLLGHAACAMGAA